MPELPEVETIRAGAAKALLNQRITEVTAPHPRAVRHHEGGPTEFASRLRGRIVTEVARRGKFMWAVLDDDQALLVHLGMSGQLRIHHPGPTQPEPHVHQRVCLTLGDGTQVWFVDQRTFGYLRVTELAPTSDGLPAGWGTARALLPEPAVHIARDLLDEHVDLPALVRATRRRRTDIKRALLDQNLVSGVGNIYADEALWAARLHATRQTNALAPKRLTELYQAASAVLREALQAGGTSFDALYVDVAGNAGYFERSLNAYGRVGLPCLRCGSSMRREVVGARASYSCPRCQRRPAVRASV